MAEVHEPNIHMSDCPAWITRFTSYPDPCDCSVAYAPKADASQPPCPVSLPGGDGLDCTCTVPAAQTVEATPDGLQNVAHPSTMSFTKNGHAHRIAMDLSEGLHPIRKRP